MSAIHLLHLKQWFLLLFVTLPPWALAALYHASTSWPLYRLRLGQQRHASSRSTTGSPADSMLYHSIGVLEHRVPLVLDQASRGLDTNPTGYGHNGRYSSFQQLAKQRAAILSISMYKPAVALAVRIDAHTDGAAMVAGC